MPPLPLSRALHTQQYKIAGTTQAITPGLSATECMVRRVRRKRNVWMSLVGLRKCIRPLLE